MASERVDLELLKWDLEAAGIECKMQSGDLVIGRIRVEPNGTTYITPDEGKKMYGDVGVVANYWTGMECDNWKSLAIISRHLGASEPARGGTHVVCPNCKGNSPTEREYDRDGMPDGPWCSTCNGAGYIMADPVPREAIETMTKIMETYGLGAQSTATVRAWLDATA